MASFFLLTIKQTFILPKSEERKKFIFSFLSFCLKKLKWSADRFSVSWLVFAVVVCLTFQSFHAAFADQISRFKQQEKHLELEMWPDVTLQLLCLCRVMVPSADCRSKRAESWCWLAALCLPALFVPTPSGAANAPSAARKPVNKSPSHFSSTDSEAAAGKQISFILLKWINGQINLIKVQS